MVSTTDLQSVGSLLIAGFVVSLVGAARWRSDYQKSPAEALPAIARSLPGWRWIHAWMIAGLATTTASLGAMSWVLADGGGAVYGPFGFVLFSLGAIVWLVAVAWRVTGLTAAAMETEQTGTVPRYFQQWSDWFGVLHTIHLLTAYASWIFIGSAVVSTEIIAVWTGWLGIGLGVAGASGYIAFKGGPFAAPILVHLYPCYLGVVLLASA